MAFILTVVYGATEAVGLGKTYTAVSRFEVCGLMVAPEVGWIGERFGGQTGQELVMW